MSTTKCAYIDVADQTGIVAFARGLAKMGVRILCARNTAQTLQDAEIPITYVWPVAREPMVMDGGVWTHQPGRGSLVANQYFTPDPNVAKESGLTEPIDLVIVNFCPFRQIIDNPDATFEQIIGLIDTDRKAMLRSAAKNFAKVTVICNPARYTRVLEEMREYDGCTLPATRHRLAYEVFDHTAVYDLAIANYFATKGPVLWEEDDDPEQRR